MKKVVWLCTLMLACTGVFARQLPSDSAEARMKEYPVLFQQSSAEYRALCYQAFNIAALRLDRLSRRKIKKKHAAIITDLDETIIDNSYGEVELIRQGKGYSSASWKEWVNKSSATAVPGAVSFLKKAAAKGLSIFYISNRDTADVATTLLNLQRLGLPNSDTAHMLFYTSSSPKEARRQLVMRDHEVVMLLGDNLNDFVDVFEKKSISERQESADELQQAWGDKFIVLPNGTYGEWENAIYKYQRNLSPAAKEALRQSALKGYEQAIIK